MAARRVKNASWQAASGRPSIRLDSMATKTPDRESFDRPAEFVKRLTAHQRDLFAYINTLLAGDLSTSDVLQDTNLDLWSRLNDYDFDRAFLPWAYGFAYQRVLAYRKTRSRSRLIFSDDAVRLISDAYISDSIGADVRIAALQECLKKLDDRQSQLIRERYVNRTSVKTMAARLGNTASHISTRLYRVRQTLAKCVEATLVAESR
jgi:RNA polymerase sigma-70 factor (ECF subfamily)